MRKWLLLGLALLAVYMGGRAARRNAEVLQLLWVLVGMTAAAGTAGTAKSRSTEARLNSLLPKVFPNTGGTVNGSMTVTGNHAVGGQLNVNGAGGSATVAVNGNVHATSAGQFDGGVSTGAGMSAGSLSVNGGSGGATVAVAGNIHASSAGQFDGGVSTSVVTATSGSTNEFTGGIHTGGSMIADGTFSAGNFTGSYHGSQGAVSSITGGTPSTYTTAWAGQVGSAVNGIIARLNSAGIT